ncbi:MAG: hypothetical protein HQM09_22465 [Candidatus Riflebacteria bacterium]|nr:hypothetical protein [Candidatus Riflebacteria bacterium]
MRNCSLSCFLCLLFLFPAVTFGYGHYTVYSPVLADVYVDNEYRATISATQTLKLILSGPQSYVIGVQAKDTGQTYKESVNVGTNMNEHRDIRAFLNSESNPQQLNAEITVYSQIPADVYVDSILKASVNATQPMAINLSGPRSYVFEVRAKGSNMIYREEVSIADNSVVKKEIRAFSEVQSQTYLPAGTVVPVPAPIQVAAPQGGISREEMNAEIHKATAQAKAEALSEEAGRRKRADQRALTNKGIAHVVGVEANPGLSGSVKNMERIKLLIEAIPSFKK